MNAFQKLEGVVGEAVDEGDSHLHVQLVRVRALPLPAAAHCDDTRGVEVGVESGGLTGVSHHEDGAVPGEGVATKIHKLVICIAAQGLWVMGYGLWVMGYGLWVWGFTAPSRASGGKQRPNPGSGSPPCPASPPREAPHSSRHSGASGCMPAVPS